MEEKESKRREELHEMRYSVRSAYARALGLNCHEITSKDLIENIIEREKEMEKEKLSDEEKPSRRELEVLLVEAMNRLCILNELVLQLEKKVTDLNEIVNKLNTSHEIEVEISKKYRSVIEKCLREVYVEIGFKGNIKDWQEEIDRAKSVSEVKEEQISLPIEQATDNNSSDKLPEVKAATDQETRCDLATRLTSGFGTPVSTFTEIPTPKGGGYISMRDIKENKVPAKEYRALVRRLALELGMPEPDAKKLTKDVALRFLDEAYRKLNQSSEEVKKNWTSDYSVGMPVDVLREGVWEVCKIIRVDENEVWVSKEEGEDDFVVYDESIIKEHKK